MSAEPDALTVPDALAGERVDRAVALLTGWSRADVQALLARGALLVDGRAPAKSHRLTAGALVELLEEPAAAGPPGPEPVPVDLRVVDDDVLVVHKPSGLVVHPGAGHEHGTLVNGLLARFPELAGVGESSRPGIVHRLDRDTSGLLVVARSSAAYTALVDALAAHAVERRYLALVHGVPDASRAVIDAPIGRAARHRTQMAVRAAGRPARTRYEVRAHDPERRVAVLDCELETGRTHQIRVHLAAIGHPVVGDPVYGRGGSDLPRPFLHAYALAFDHPSSGARVTAEAALPGELAGVLAERGVAPPELEDRPARADGVEAAG